MSKEKSKDLPQITFTKDEPYIVKGLKDFKNSKLNDIPVSPVMALCRCGESKKKPFCDGTHGKIGFKGDKEPDRRPDRIDEYIGKEVTIVDNRGVCARYGACVAGLPKVFRFGVKPWIDPDGAPAEDIIETIELCPSGALSYKKDGVWNQELDRPPLIKIAKGGPYHVEGHISLQDDQNSTPQSKEHYTLCRCGGSMNKPFCDASHKENGFKDDEN